VRLVVGPEPGVESLITVVHPQSSLTARPSHPGFQPAFPLAAVSGNLADAPYEPGFTPSDDRSSIEVAIPQMPWPSITLRLRAQGFGSIPRLQCESQKGAREGSHNQDDSGDDPPQGGLDR
jgi:hypothetical protein